MALTKVTYPMIQGAPVSVFEFMTNNQIAAVQNGTAGATTGISDAVTTAIETLIANGKNTLYFPDGTYYFNTPVSIVINEQYGPSLRFVGNSTCGLIQESAGGTTITGNPSIESLFLFTKDDLTEAGGYAFECEHINFVGGGGTLSAIKNLIGGFPARPFVIHNCNFQGFGYAISCDITTFFNATGNGTGLGQVVITQCNFQGNTAALYGKANFAISDLVFTGNVCEQNTNGILTENLGLGGTFVITDNLLEGQPNAIDLSVNWGNGEIARNYFEQNTGALMKVDCGGNSSSLTIKDNFIATSSNAYAQINIAKLACYQNFEKAGVDLYVDLLSDKSIIQSNQMIRYLVPNTVRSTIGLDVTSVSTKTSFSPVSGAYVAVSASAEDTPIGTVNVARVNGVTGPFTASTGYAAGDLLVFQALVRNRTENDSTISLKMYDSASVYDTESESTFQLISGMGEWVYVQIVLKATLTSVSTFKFVWNTISTLGTGDVDVTDTYVYKIASPTSTSKIHMCLPNP